MKGDMNDAGRNAHEAAVALYLLLGQQPALFRRWREQHGGCARALAALRRHPAGLGDARRAVVRDWPDGPAATATQRQWQHALDWLALPGNTLWQDCATTLPAALAGLPPDECPPLLFLAGNAEALALPQIAVVGSRAATRYGLDQARRIAADLAQGGFAITSGLASGIDGAAHEGALAVGGRTLAVLGCGPDICYPPSHAGLARRIIAEGGLLLSAYVPGTRALRHHFPERNRIISALSLGVLVVEAGPDSGSILTARAAHDMSRDVWALPGPVTSLQSRGCHQLLRHEQAQLVEGATDVVADALPRLREWLGPQASASSGRAAPELAPRPMPVERRVLPCTGAATLLAAMDTQPWSLDALMAAGHGQASVLMAWLGELEVAGWVAVVPGGWQRVPA